MVKISDAIIVGTRSATKNYVDKNLDLKVNKIAGKGLSTEDFSSEEKLKLSEIEDEANKTIITQTSGTSETSVMSQKAVTEAISKVDIPIASRGTMPTTGIDISELDITKGQWIRKIVFNEEFTVPSSASLRLKCKDLIGTYSIYFASPYIEIYQDNGSRCALIYSSGSFKNSLTTAENITWDLDTRTLSFDNCIYQFTIDKSSSNTISSLTNVGKIYLDTVDGVTGVLSPIDIKQIENQNSLTNVEGKSDSIGITQKTVTYALNDLRDQNAALQNSVVSNTLLNFTNWDLVLLSNNLASYQAARYGNTTTSYGKMALEYNSNTKNVIVRAIYKQSSAGGTKVKLFTFKNLINNSNSPQFLFYADTSYYYIIDMKTRNVYRGDISTSGVPSETITQISTLPSTNPDFSYYDHLRILAVNGLLYVIKTDTNGGTWTVCVSTDLGGTWQSTGIEVNKVNFLRYIDGKYYMGMYLSSASPQYALLSSEDGINFTDLHAANPEIYDVVYDSSNNIWYGLAFSSWMSGTSIGEMSKVSDFTMHGDMLCRFSTSYPLGVMGFNNGRNYLSNIYVTKDCITSKDSKQTFPKINDNSFFTYQPLEVSNTNTNITTIMRINNNYYLGELKNYYGKLNPTIKIPPEFCVPNFSSSGTYSLKVVNGKIQWIKD